MRTMRSSRLPRERPMSIEAEQSVLGSLLISDHALERVEDRLTESDFFRREHQLIYRAIRDLAQRQQPRDAVTLAEWFETQNLGEQTGGANYVLELVSTTPSAANVAAYAAIVREKAILRQIIEVCAASADVAFNPEGRSSEEVLSDAEARLLAIADARRRPGQGFVPIRDPLKATLTDLEWRFQNHGATTGIQTGFKELDGLTTGWQAGDLIILAARPSMGKTALALNMAEHAVFSSGKAVAVFSLEMSGPQLAARLLSSVGRINQQHLRTGELKDDEWGRLTEAVSKLHGAKLFIDETPALSPTDVRSRARRLSREHEVGLIIVDYLQLMQLPDASDNRTNEISAISRGLKALAKEMGVPVIALSQLNRGLEQRVNKRPMMSDLRESGAIEQDADVILFIYRDEKYNEDSPDKGTAEIIVAKQRNGPTGMVRLGFQGQYTRFESLVHSFAVGFE